MIAIGKEYHFEAAHRLPNHGGHCRNLHGHGYRLEVEVQGQVLEGSGSSEGMLMDFKELDLVVAPLVDDLDHSCLNDSIVGVSYQPPTAEHIALFFRDHIVDHLPVGISLRRVTVWETAKCWAEWRV